jgi:hypothetical protein
MPEFTGFLDYNGTIYELAGSDAETIADILNGYRKGEETMFRFKPANSDAHSVLIALSPGVPITLTWRRSES